MTNRQTSQTSEDALAVHDVPEERRVPRGIRMDESLWRFVDAQAGVTDDGNASRLIERWVREKLEAVRKVA